MKIKIIDKKGEKLRFLLQDSTPAFANAMRRVMMNEVPNLAMDSVEFQDNTSALFDEVIAHRLGMLPLVFKPGKFNFPDECKCKGKGCPSCQVFFALEKTGPGMVYSSDMKSANKSVKPTSPDFPIVKLIGKQKIKFESVAVLGRGKDHAKFQTANVSYNYLPVLDAGKVKNVKRVVNSCPKGVLGIKNRKLVMLDPYECDECRVCEETDSHVKIKNDETKFVFNVESISGLRPKQIAEEAIKVLQDKADDFKGQLKGI